MTTLEVECSSQQMPTRMLESKEVAVIDGGLRWDIV